MKPVYHYTSECHHLPSLLIRGEPRGHANEEKTRGLPSKGRVVHSHAALAIGPSLLMPTFCEDRRGFTDFCDVGLCRRGGRNGY
jgi:hypothetical protein